MPGKTPAARSEERRAAAGGDAVPGEPAQLRPAPLACGVPQPPRCLPVREEAGAPGACREAVPRAQRHFGCLIIEVL